MACLSCTKDMILDVNRGAAIDFTVAAHTRAHETTTSNLETFYVTAVDPRQANNYFTDVAYIKSGEIFHSSPTYYWPGDGSELDFYAYAPSATDLGASVSIDRDAQKLIDYSPSSDISQQCDFIAASMTQGRIETSVPVYFKHALSQIEVRARNRDAGQVYRVKGIRIAQIKSKGSYDFKTGLWELGEEKEIYEVTYDDARIMDADGVNIMKEKGDNAMLLPQDLVPWNPLDDKTNVAKGAYISVYVNITTSAGSAVYPAQKDEYAWLAVAIETDWQAGNRYIYTLDFTNGAGYPDPTSPETGNEIFGNEISFDVDITPWNESQPKDHQLVGQWNLSGAGFTGIVGDEELDVHLPSLGAMDQLGILDYFGEQSLSITFETSKTFYLNGDRTSYETTIVDGKLCLMNAGGIQAVIVEYDDATMTVDFINEGTGETYRLYYVKYGCEDQVDQEEWKHNLAGKWRVCKYRYVVTPLGGEPEETVYESFDEIVAQDGLIQEEFLYLTFTTWKVWHPYKVDAAFYSFYINERLTLLADTPDGAILIAYYINDIDQDTMNVSVSANYDGDHEELTLYYEKEY